MRIFWAIVGIVIVVAAALAIVPAMRDREAAAQAQLARQQESIAREQALKAKAEADKAKAAAESKPIVAAPVAVPPAPSVPVKTTQEPAKTETPAKKVEQAETTKPAAAPVVKEQKSEKTPDGTSSEELLKIVGGGGDAPKAEVPEVKELPKIEKLPNGTQKVDDKFIIKGAGTKADPYVISWDHLLSIQETFDPSQKKDKIPSRISFIDGTYVKLTGYICFPLYVPQPKELLAMMNQWDGCCIGVPPTAYDAVEVQLRTKVGEDDRYAVHGSVTGKFQVKPYVTGNWLVGLYLMTDAEFEPSQNAGGN